MLQIILLCVNWDVLHAPRLISGLEAWSPPVAEFSLRGSSLGPLPTEQLHTNKVHLKRLGSAGALELPQLPDLCYICIRSPDSKARTKTASMSDSVAPGSWPQNHWDSHLPQQPKQGEPISTQAGGPLTGKPVYNHFIIHNYSLAQKNRLSVLRQDQFLH